MAIVLSIDERIVGKTTYFVAKCVNISKTVRDTMTLDEHELYKFEFSENFSEFRRFRTQQQLNE